MPDPWVPDPAPYVDSGDPIALSPGTYARHARAVNRVLGDNQARYPYPNRGRTTSPAAGRWAVLKAGNSITAVSGMTLGHGTVTLASRSDGGVLAADGEDIICYNGGAAINAATDKPLLLHWSDGVWSAAKCG